MKSFAERNPLVTGAVGLAVTVGALLIAVNYDKLPFVNQNERYSAYFAEIGGLAPGVPVLVSGLAVGKVSNFELDGRQVLVRFEIDKHIRLGNRTEAAIKTNSVLGAKVLEVTPRGDDIQKGPIPIERTRPPYLLPDALAEVTQVISGMDTGQLSESLSTLSQTFANTPPQLKVAVQGVARFSETLDKRDAQLRNLLANANKATGVLAQRSDQVVKLIADTNALLVQLRTQSSALDEIAGNLSALAQQVRGFISDNRTALKPALEKLNGALAIVDNRKDKVRDAIKRLNSYAMSLGEAVSSGPFFKAYVWNLLPGQFLQPFIDAAFSDLGLDPNTRLPSQVTDPQVGQPGTPPLPMPYPRTGQGGEPRRTLPDAITGNPGDQQCGVSGAPLSGPGCYPYRPPEPAPPAGGPPPGPPAPPPQPSPPAGAGAQ
ncbi:MCE family protein [Mycobacterium vicinigordonae]|uniref:MCE family protein n=1 Tax=Mycobacterium vicinigordonae TaxID=1719132 RepID=A0A7D6HTG8_9MYCO|nr:MCE family protein [Mycobacterium vicinigordonae]QLL06253.1 MCE family protein [Mycobacterium vicinigordonae]